MTDAKRGRPFSFDPPPHIREAIRENLAGGDSLQMVADSYGVSWVVMKRFAERYDLKPPTRGKEKRGKSKASLANLPPPYVPSPLPSATGDLAGVRLGLGLSVQAIRRGASAGLLFNSTRDETEED